MQNEPEPPMKFGPGGPQEYGITPDNPPLMLLAIIV